MSALGTKLRRDLWLMRGQVVTIALVVASGVAILIASLSAYHSLAASRDHHYAQSRFADVFASLKRAPLGLADRIAAIPGVAEAEARLVFDAVVDMPGSAAPTTVRLVGLPADGPPTVNRLHLVAGRFPEPAAPEEAVVSAGFAEANRLGPGGRLRVLTNGRYRAYTIVGVALSPEYVFTLPPGDALPDDRRFGVLWVDRASLADAYDAAGAFDDVVLRLAPGASAESVMAELDRLLVPYGGLGALDRGLQASNRFVSDELVQQGTMAATIPPVFLFVAAFLLQAVVSRLIATQREQIAALKALGYRDGEIARHYAGFVLAIVALGVVLGIGLGILFGELMMLNYRPFFRFPALDYRLRAWLPAAAGAVALVAGLAATAMSLTAVFRLRPAEAMRPPAPPRYRHLPFERAAGRLSPRWTMVLRGIVAHPLRALLTVVGVILAVPLIVMSLFWGDALDYVVEVQFAAAERSDAVIGFVEPLPERVVAEVARLPGVLLAEPMRAVSVRLVAGRHDYRTAIVGLDDRTSLRRLLDERLAAVDVPAEGLVLARRLAERLGVAVGDGLDVEVLQERRPVRRVTVVALVDDLIGLSAYMNVRAMARVMGDDGRVSAVAVRLDPAARDAFHAAVKAVPKIASLGMRASTIENFRRTTAATVLVVGGVFTLFALPIAFGVVYNDVRIAFQERATELATLRILGLTRAEVARILFAEVGLELALGIPLGLVAGTWFVRALLLAFETEMFRIPAVIQPGSHLGAGLLVVAATAISMAAVGRRLWRLDLVGALKARE